MNCNHNKTVIWEPHLAGARKCLDCKMVYNPNRSPAWFYEYENKIKTLKLDFPLGFIIGCFVGAIIAQIVMVVG